MHEIRLTVPPAHVDEAVRLAHGAGIRSVVTTPVQRRLWDSSREAISISAETSTPLARAFVRAALHAPWFDRGTCSLSTRELRAIVSDLAPADITRPMVQPGVEVMQDLWQLNQLSASYVGRTVAAACLMAFGVGANDLIAIVVAAIFLPFLSCILGIAYGIWYRDRALAASATRALLVSIAAAIGAGALVGLLRDAPEAYQGFRTLGANLALAIVIGAAAGLNSADDAGRRYLIGVAAAAQLGVFPVWFGMAAVTIDGGLAALPGRIATFVLTVIAVGIASIAMFAAVGIRRDEADHHAPDASGGARPRGPGTPT